MPKFEVTIEREVPSVRERAIVLVEADSMETIANDFDFDTLCDIDDLEWEEVMEGHGGFPCDYDIELISPVEDETVDVDIVMTDSDDTN